jgi:hypothetical protein
MKRLILLLASAFLLASVPSSAEPPVRTTTLPFEVLPSKHLAVPVKLNGRGPYRVIFDTGAPVLILGTKAARSGGVLPENVEVPRDTPFGTAGQFPIQKLEIGTLRQEKVPALVMDHPAVASLSKAGGPLDGIVGYPFFSRYRMTIDYPAKKLTLVPNGYEPEDVLQMMADRLTGKKKPPPRLLDPAGVWGFAVSKEKDDNEPGVTVTEVRPGTAAAETGLAKGDRLLTLDGRWIDTTADCYLAASFVKPGTAVPLVVRRDGKEKKLTVTPRAGL